MKVKLLVKLGELILGKAFSEDEPRADMYLPIWLLAFGMILLIGGGFLGILAIMFFSIGAGIGALVIGGTGITAILCWKNQTIRILSSDTFEYSTFFGNKTIYRFSDIKRLRQNRDSMTLFVSDGKVHMESCAIVTERLAKRINEQLEIVYGSEREEELW